MRYFELEPYLLGVSPDPDEQLRWAIRAGKTYERYLDSIRGELPTRLAPILEVESLHDVWIKSVRHHGDTLSIVVLYPGPTPRGSLDEEIELTYKDVRDLGRVTFDVDALHEPRLMQQFSDLRNELWLIDEFRRVDGETEHHILFHQGYDNYGMLCVRFRDFELEIRPVPEKEPQAD